MLNILTADSRPGGSAENEDRWGHSLAAAWVIDGATSVFNRHGSTRSDAAWFAEQADRELSRLLAHPTARPTEDLLLEVVSACRAAFLAAGGELSEPGHAPSATFAMVREMPGGLEFSTLGDCRIIYGDDESAHVFGTSGVTAVEQGTLMAARGFLDANPGLTSEGLKELLLPKLRENRMLMNRAGGYWVLGMNEEAISHLDRQFVTGDRIDCAIASDGFLRLMELFEEADAEDLLGIRNPEALDRTFTLLRAREAADRDCRTYLRVKCHDDATFVRLRNEAG